ncbi:MAG TPA: hypothetical protein VF522_07955 [Ramlibacter sp.]|uniref:hypothetical protein n=1 Tax=Ramlibacter sp. TaxID=1917967 RepID=UPI002ED604C8
MTSSFVPFVPAGPAPVRRRKSAARTRQPATRVRRASQARLGGCVLVTVLLLEAALLFFPERLLLDPMQAAHWAKQLTGYAMVTLMVLAMVFGPLRRAPAMARHQAWLNECHQFSGLLLLLLLAFHMGRAPSGFLQYTFHVLAAGVAAGALRSVLGTKASRALARTLLVAHISLSCLVAAGAMLHLYLVYAYTA